MGSFYSLLTQSEIIQGIDSFCSTMYLLEFLAWLYKLGRRKLDSSVGNVIVIRELTLRYDHNKLFIEFLSRKEYYF